MKTYLFIPFLCLFSLVGNSQNNTKIVENFIESYNKKDSLATFKVLHKDFIELWKKDTVINSKTIYYDHFSWGKIMNDREEIKILKANEYEVKTLSVYYSDRDSLLGITPYTSKRIYTFRNNQIYRIIGGDYEGYEDYEKSRRASYSTFFEWLEKKHNLKPEDFKFNEKEAVKLKGIIKEYRSKKN